MSNKNLGKPLTAELVFTKTKSDSLHNIKNLNLWGNDLQDLSLIQKMPNLQVISLSVNRINSLKDFSHCNKLQQLYLRKNNISDIREIRYLLQLPMLKVLWLHDNPCAQIENYREIVVKNLPNLMKLDNNPVTPEERAASQAVVFSLEVPNDSNFKSEKSQGGDYYPEKKRPASNIIQPLNQKQPPRISSEFEQNPYNQYRNHSQPQPLSSPQVLAQSSQKQRAEREKHKRNSQSSKKHVDGVKEEDINRNQNILMAILSLMRELDTGSLEIVRREAEKMLR